MLNKWTLKSTEFADMAILCMSEGEAKVLSSCFLTQQAAKTPASKHSDENKTTRPSLDNAKVAV